jgi:hypothetical protein
MRQFATGAAAFACLIGGSAAAESLAAVGKATWKANATPAWSKTLTGYQVSFFRHKKTLGIETPNWVTLVCTPTDGGGTTPVGRFGAHFESKRHRIATQYGIGKSKALKGVYDTARFERDRDLSVLRIPPGVPAPSAFRGSFYLRPKQGSVKGSFTLSVSWAGVPDAPYKSCKGTFKIQPR